MLGETAKQIQELINKIQVLDLIMSSLTATHKDHVVDMEQQFKEDSLHKLKLTSEVARLLGVKKEEK